MELHLIFTIIQFISWFVDLCASISLLLVYHLQILETIIFLILLDILIPIQTGIKVIFVLIFACLHIRLILEIALVTLIQHILIITYFFDAPVFILVLRYLQFHFETTVEETIASMIKKTIHFNMFGLFSRSIDILVLAFEVDLVTDIIEITLLVLYIQSSLVLKYILSTVVLLDCLQLLLLVAIAVLIKLFDECRLILVLAIDIVLWQSILCFRIIVFITIHRLRSLIFCILHFIERISVHDLYQITRSINILWLGVLILKFASIDSSILLFISLPIPNLTQLTCLALLSHLDPFFFLKIVVFTGFSTFQTQP